MFGYDRPYAHPVSSFENPVTPPDAEPDEGSQVSVCFNEAWLPYVLGALYQLYLQTTWKADSAGILLAQQRATKLTSLFVSPTCVAGEVPAPYWEEGIETDDELPADEQPWYGYISEGNFIEDAGVFIISNFLATTLTPQAAVLYATHQRKVRLSFLKGGLGGVVKVYADDVLAAVVDLFGTDGEVLEVDVLTGYVDEAVEILQVLDSV